MADYYVTFRGTLAAAQVQEIFVHSMATLSSAPAETVAADYAAQWIANMLPANWNPAVAYQEVTVAEILAAEPPQPRLAAATHFPCVLVGTSAGSMLPTQNAVAVSIYAGLKPNGVPAKGRFYLPPPSQAYITPTTGTLSSAHATSLRDQVADWWAGVRQLGHQPALWSRTRGTVIPWDSIRVGGTVDTIRRRRNELPEVYTQTVAVP